MQYQTALISLVSLLSLATAAPAEEKRQGESQTLQKFDHSNLLPQEVSSTPLRPFIAQVDVQELLMVKLLLVAWTFASQFAQYSAASSASMSAQSLMSSLDAPVWMFQFTSHFSEIQWLTSVFSSSPFLYRCCLHQGRYHRCCQPLRAGQRSFPLYQRYLPNRLGIRVF